MTESLHINLITAVLLTGDARRAEAAVLETIETLNPDEITPDTLLEATVSAALKVRPLVGRRGEPVPDSWLLPPELRRVLRLPRVLRLCFVLRVLAGWPPERCARVLHLDSHEVDDNACDAARELATLSGNKQAAQWRLSLNEDAFHLCY